MIINVVDCEDYRCPESIGSQCRGKQCMAWRWTDTRRVYGYCGLAGEPLSNVIEKLRQEC